MDVGKTCAATAARALCADARNAREDARDADRQKRRSGTNSRGAFLKKYRMRRIIPQRYYFISVLPTFFGALFHLSQREKTTPHRHLPLPLQKGATQPCGLPSKTSQLFVKTQRLFSLSPLV